MHSAPSSPGQNNLNNNMNNVVQSNITSPQPTNPKPVGTATSDNKTASLKLNKKVNKMHQAKEYLTNLLSILSRSKNSPVWPYEFITAHNYSKQLTSVQILNDFVLNLKNFLQICFSTKQISTISSASTRSFSSPINLTTRFSTRNSSSSMNNIDKKWSNYALITSLNNSISHHYASRSLQIYRALGVKISSFATMASLIRRLVETVADLNEDLQSYVTEILLTLKMNAMLISEQYIEGVGSQSIGNNASANNNAEKEASVKQKSKSLQVFNQIKYKIIQF